jgi:hypothetical protein
MALENQKMKTGRLIIVFLLSLCACSDDGEGIDIFSINYNFQSGAEGWLADFTDYPVNENPEADTIYHWKAELINSPSGTNGAVAYMLSCDNINGDIFMFLKKKIGGLKPNTNYNVVYEIALSSTAQIGQGIILKAGASDMEPKKVIENNYYVLNIDKGSSTLSGENAISFGDIGGSSSYSSIIKGNAGAYEPFRTRTNSKGELWLILGTESLYQGITSVYFTNINLIFSVSE